MMNKKVLVLASKKDAYINAMSKLGLSLTVCKTYNELKALLDTKASADIFSAIVLLSDPAQNCQSAWYISSSYEGTYILARSTSYTDIESIALLSAGVNFVLKPSDKDNLLVSALIAKWQWLNQKQNYLNDADSDNDIKYAGTWYLTDQSWFLNCPDGQQMRLTLSERVVVTSLFLAPGHICSNEYLYDAFTKVPMVNGKPRKKPDLRSVINRLRTHAQEQGLPEPPIIALRGYGYMWPI